MNANFGFPAQKEIQERPAFPTHIFREIVHFFHLIGYFN